MNKSVIALVVLVSVAVVLLASAATSPSPSSVVERGRYLVTAGGCNDCHTPLKMGPKGPEPDMARMLSGHPAGTTLPPPPPLPPGPWNVVTAGLTAWSGPWGISYTANITPDVETGIGGWTEEMFVKTMRTGKHLGMGRDILPPMPWQSIGLLTDADLKAIFAYLKSVPKISNQVPDPVPPAHH